MKRSSGILLPIFSLPSLYGIGTMGREAYMFADFLHAAGQSYWQLLPLGPTSQGDSPYQSFSTYAGNPYFIDLELLVRDGLLTEADLDDHVQDSSPRRIDYGKLYETRFPILRKAYQAGYTKEKSQVDAFVRDNAWLPDYALFMAVKKHFGMQSWLSWPDEDIRLRRPGAVERYSKLLKDDVQFYTYLRYLFYRQWNQLLDYVHS